MPSCAARRAPFAVEPRIHIGTSVPRATSAVIGSPPEAGV